MTSASTASYVMALGRNLPASIDRNYPVFGPGATAANVNARRPIQPGTLGAVRMLESTFHSDYHALQMSAEKRGARFSAKAYYTYGKAEEDVDYQGGGLPAVQNSNKIDIERGRTSADRRHVFTFSGIYAVNHLGNARRSCERCSTTGRFPRSSRLQSGTPFTVAAGTDRNFDGLTNDRADINGDPKLDASRPREELIENWFNIAVFSNPAIGADGTAGRNIIDGPGIRNVDLGLYRDVRLIGPTRLQFRVEATNVFNIVNLMNPGATLECAGDLRQDSFGQGHADDSARRAFFVLIGGSKTRLYDGCLSLHAAGGIAGREPIDFLHADAVEVAGDAVLQRARRDRKAQAVGRRSGPSRIRRSGPPQNCRRRRCDRRDAGRSAGSGETDWPCCPTTPRSSRCRSPTGFREA